VPAQAVAHRGHHVWYESSGPRAGRSRDETFDMFTSISGASVAMQPS
jgi:hypothetical protein